MRANDADDTAARKRAQDEALQTEKQAQNPRYFDRVRRDDIFAQEDFAMLGATPD